MPDIAASTSTMALIPLLWRVHSSVKLLPAKTYRGLKVPRVGSGRDTVQS